MQKELLEWPYPVNYGKESEVNTDVLVLGGGIAGCWAAISAAKKGLRVAIVEKGATIRSGAGGAGCDHWQWASDNPCSKISPEELAQALIDNHGGYRNGISTYIQCASAYETLLELEEMGAKVRDTDDEFKGAEFRDGKTKLLFAYDYDNKIVIRIWGTTFKPTLYKECQRLGVEIYDRTMATSLLTEGGKQGARVVGATGLNVRTGEFYIFKAKATVLCLSRPQRNWTFSSELRGLSSFRPPNNVGNGHAMAWRAGAAFTMMEKSIPSAFGSGYSFPPYGSGNPFNTWYACSMVDANGKEIPWVDRDGRVLLSISERYHPAPGQKFFLMGGGNASQPHPGLYEYMGPRLIPDLGERIEKGEFTLPLYADLPSMPEQERRAIWGLMVGQEGKTRIPILQTYTQAGFDPDKDLLQSYQFLRGDMMREPVLPQERTFGEVGVSGGLVVDWDLKSSLDGLYGAGDLLFGGQDHSHAATTGRYAGKRAAEYALRAGAPVIDRDQIEAEKSRVYTPIKRRDGMEWKELNAGICRVMQNYCGEIKNEELLKIGLIWLRDIEEREAPIAGDPHKLMRTLDVLDIITCSQMIIHACLARKASSQFLHFRRSDYPEVDPADWHKWVTIKLEEGEVKIGELPFAFWGPLKENYEAHCGKGK